MSRPITTNEVELVIKKLSIGRGPRPDKFTDEFFKTFEDEPTTILKVFKNFERKENFHAYFRRPVLSCSQTRQKMVGQYFDEQRS